MAVKKKIINIRVYFDGDQDAKEVFAEVIAQKIRDTKTKDKLAIMKDKQYNDYEFSEFTSNTKIKYAIENIETYSWSMHRVHEREAVLEKKKNESEKQGFWSRVAQALHLAFHKQEEDGVKDQTDDTRKEDPTDFQLDFSDFNFVKKFGYPDNGTRCIYVWKTKNGIYQWQIGEYVSKKRQFVIKFSDQTFITDWRKVIAWKYIWKGDLNWSYGEKNEEDTDRN